MAIAAAAGCDPIGTYSVRFDSAQLATPPSEDIVVDTSQAGDALLPPETAFKNTHPGALETLTYRVAKPIRIIVVPQDLEADDR